MNQSLFDAWAQSVPLSDNVIDRRARGFWGQWLDNLKDSFHALDDPMKPMVMGMPRVSDEELQKLLQQYQAGDSRGIFSW